MIIALSRAIPIICVGIGIIGSKYLNGDLDPEVSLQKAKTENIKAKIREEETRYASRTFSVTVVEKKKDL